MTLTLRHAAAAAYLAGCAALAVTVTIPAASTDLDRAATTRAQAQALRELAADKAPGPAKLKQARAQLPPSLAPEAAVAAVAALAERAHLTWSDLAVTGTTTTSVATSVADTAVTTTTVTATVTGDTSEVTASATPLMTVSDLALEPAGTGRSRADVTIAVHSAHLSRATPGSPR